MMRQRIGAEARTTMSATETRTRNPPSRYSSTVVV